MGTKIESGPQAITSRTMDLPDYTLHDAAFVLVGEEPCKELSHAASEMLQRLLAAARTNKRRANELAVTERRRLGDESISVGVTLAPPKRRRRMFDGAPSIAVSEGPHGVQVRPMLPPGPKELVVTNAELQRWAKRVGMVQSEEPEPKKLGKETRECFLRLVHVLVLQAKEDISKPYAAVSSITQKMAAHGIPPISGDFIGRAFAAIRPPCQASVRQSER